MGNFLTKGNKSVTPPKPLTVGTGATPAPSSTSSDPNKEDENGVSYSGPDTQDPGGGKIRVQMPDGSYQWIQPGVQTSPVTISQGSTSQGGLAAGGWGDDMKKSDADVPVNLETDGLVNTLDQAIQSGQNVVTANVQSQANQAANLGRLQAGAGTLGGNYAASGAAAQGSEATMGQHVLQNAGLSAAQASNDLEGTYGQALSQNTSQHQAMQQETLNRNVQSMSDEIDKIKAQIAGRKDAQALSIQKYLDDVTAAMMAYRNTVASGNATFQMVGDLYGGILGAVSKVMAMA